MFIDGYRLTQAQKHVTEICFTPLPGTFYRPSSITSTDCSSRDKRQTQKGAGQPAHGGQLAHTTKGSQRGRTVSPLAVVGHSINGQRLELAKPARDVIARSRFLRIPKNLLGIVELSEIAHLTA